MRNWILHKLRDQEPEALATAKLLLTFMIVTSLACSTFVPVYYFLNGMRLATFAAFITPLIASSMLVLRWTGSLKISAHYYLTTAWLFITGVVVLQGGIISPGTPAYFILVMGSTFMVGRRAGIVWTAICVITLSGAELMSDHWIPTTSIPATQLSMLGITSYGTIMILVSLFALKYDEAKDDAMQELRNVNRRTAYMISKLENASDRLIHSSEQLLGTEQDKSRGLVGLMLKTARAGRHTIEEAKESISGMIEQYRHISERVQDLYRHTQTIVELVSTIDRISGRLDLMALNIGIEAARSGGSGKQFTMIAQDMRILAERVLNETQRIKNSLVNVNAQAQRVLQSSTFGQDLTEESVTHINAMVSTFDEIYTLIEMAEGTTEKVTADTLAQIAAVRRLVTAAETGTSSLLASSSS